LVVRVLVGGGDAAVGEGAGHGLNSCNETVARYLECIGTAVKLVFDTGGGAVPEPVDFDTAR
jgi:hypothetical protein